MSAGAQRSLVPAVGGTRHVPEPDPIAADYLRLGLRLDQHAPGTVDGYFGPAELKAEVDLAQLRPLARLREDAVALRERVASDVGEDDRRAWLDAQLVALEAHAATLAGDGLPYAQHVERCMGFAPVRRPDTTFDAARAAIDELVPGDAPLPERLDAWDRTLEIPVERVPAVIAPLVADFRSRAEAAFGLPAGEDLTVRLVTNQPWSGYNWFDGGRRSRVDVNTDLPVRAPDLVHTIAHETYPGHHLEHAWKEAELVDRLGRLEASILLINTPECPVSEGLADLGVEFAVPPETHVELLVEVMTRGALAIAADRVAVREAAERAVALTQHRATLRASRGEAAFRRHADGASRETVLDYLVTVGGDAPVVAAKRLEFIDHPLWRTYVFVYADGEALLRRWLDAAPPEARVARFGRLLREQLTPSSILAMQG